MFTKFNRVLLASGLVLTSLVGFGSSAFAEGENIDDIVVTGTLTEEQTVVITPGADQDFDFATDTLSALVIGTVTTTSNVPWILSAASENDSKLVRPAADGTVISYTFVLTEGTASGSILAAAQSLDADGVQVASGAYDKALAGATMQLAITSNTTGMKAGVYSDTITLTISAP
jgi:hypothetical protein